MKQTLVGVSKQLWSVVPFLGVNRQDIDMHAEKSHAIRKFGCVFPITTEGK